MHRLGYGVAVKTAIEQARGDYIVFTMADGSEPPQDVARMIETSRNNPKANIFGNRFANESIVTGYPTIKRVFNTMANWLASLVLGSTMHDLTNGFKLFHKKPLLNAKTQFADDFSITLQLSIAVILSGQPVIEMPNSWLGREAGRSKFKLRQQIIPYSRALIRRIRL